MNKDATNLKEDINKKIKKYKRSCNVWLIGLSMALLINLMYALYNPLIIILGFLIFTVGNLIYNRLVLNYYLLLKEIN